MTLDEASGVNELMARPLSEMAEDLDKKATFNFSAAMGIATILALFIVAYLAYTATTPSLYTEYSAVRLTNGDTYYGKLKGLGSKFPVMTEVFTIADSVTPTGQQGSIMRPRANEFHAPARTILNSEQILFVESVAAASQVGQLIKKMPKQ